MGRDADAPGGQEPPDDAGQEPTPQSGSDAGAGEGQDPKPTGGEPSGKQPKSPEELRREAGEWRTKFRSSDTAREAAEAALKTEQGKTSTLETENRQLKNELQELRLGGTVSAAASKLGFRNPELASRVIDKAALKFDDKGSPTNIDELLQQVLEANPYLAAASPDFGGGNRGTAPAGGPTMTDLIRAASGRG